MFKFQKLAFLLAGVSILSCCSRPEERKNSPVRNVIVTSVEPSGETFEKSYSGVVEEGKSVNAAFMTGGKLASLNVKTGDRVRKGQLLATIDDTDYQIGVNQLKVQYRQMTDEKKRMDEMFARGNIAPNDYEKFEAGYEQLKLQMEMAENKLGYTRLFSPSDGFVAFRYMEPGELVDAGTPIYKITDDSSLEVSADLPLQVYQNRADILSARGAAPGIGEEIPLKIESFSPDADNNQLYHMKLDIPSAYSKELTPGMNMTVTLRMKNEINGEALVPSRALFYENGKTYVWIFNPSDSTLKKQPVAVIGEPLGNQSLVSGLEGREKIVAAGVKQLKEGEKVNVVPNPVSSVK